MKTIMCVMLVAIMMVIGTKASESHPRSVSRDSTVPAFIWSSSSYFTKGSHQIKATLSAADISDALNVLTTNSEVKTNPLVELINQEAHPEAIIIFVEPELRTDLISKHAANLPHLQKLLKKARTSIEIPYILAKPSDSILTSPLSSSVSSSVNVILARDDSDNFEVLAKEPVVQVKISELSQYITSSNVLNNGKVDIIVVSFEWTSESSLPSVLSEHDEILAKIAAVAAKDTVFMYIADSSIPSSHTWAYGQQRFTYQYYNYPTAEGNNTNNTNNTNRTMHHKINYFPGAFLEILIVSAFFLAMLFSGGCALFGLQTPDRWDPPKALKVKEI
eukprot:TRINITY_DN757_c0_g1_i1.p1 TRINITY_DN757_c0_g1~~TRINITY_DN757_c0_g1_i1.p1  ORF type:complete len:333 (+),score=77.99 TRINITY_DN757_c0_g1_i1:135-1133(+)